MYENKEVSKKLGVVSSAQQKSAVASACSRSSPIGDPKHSKTTRRRNGYKSMRTPSEQLSKKKKKDKDEAHTHRHTEARADRRA